MKIRTEVHAGECPGQWYYGVVEQASGGGYYGAVRGDDGLVHYFNYGYTQFCPYSQGTTVGQRVAYSPFEPPNERAGKIACLSPAPAY
jgi:hypothetical protein